MNRALITCNKRGPAPVEADVFLVHNQKDTVSPCAPTGMDEFLCERLLFCFPRCSDLHFFCQIFWI